MVGDEMEEAVAEEEVIVAEVAVVEEGLEIEVEIIHLGVRICPSSVLEIIRMIIIGVVEEEEVAVVVTIIVEVEEDEEGAEEISITEVVFNKKISKVQ